MICVAANPSADATFAVDRLERGEIHRPSELVRVAGGKALNVARAAARLGGEARVDHALARARRAWLGEELRREGVAFERSPSRAVCAAASRFSTARTAR